MIGIENIWICMFIGAGLLGLVRAGLGPTFADRFLGISVFANIITLLMVYQAIVMAKEFYLDIAMLIVMLSFVGSLAIAKYAPKRETPLKTSMKAEKPRKDAPPKSGSQVEKPTRRSDA